MPRINRDPWKKEGGMARSKRGQDAERLHGKGLDMALEYIEAEIRKLEERKEELEQMSERLMAKHDLLERELGHKMIK